MSEEDLYDYYSDEMDMHITESAEYPENKEPPLVEPPWITNAREFAKGETRIPWLFYMCNGKGFPGICPAVAVNARFLVVAQSCLKRIGRNRGGGLTVSPKWSGKEDPERPIKVKSLVEYTDFEELRTGEIVNDLAVVEVEVGKNGSVPLTRIPVCLPSTTVNCLDIGIRQSVGKGRDVIIPV